MLLFGRNKVPPGMHLFAACMVALVTFISAFWILAANSWMHTPVGTELADGIFGVTSWGQAIFNPSFPYRFAHMVVASFLTGSFVVAGVSAWYLLTGREVDTNRRALSMCLWLILIGARPGGDRRLSRAAIPWSINRSRSPPWKATGRLPGSMPLLLFAIPGSGGRAQPYGGGYSAPGQPDPDP